MLSEIYYLLSEVELVFGIWILPLILGYFFVEGLDQTLLFLQKHDYTYALYMAVIIAVVSTRPIVALSERCLEFFSKLGGDNANSWWWTVLTAGPLLTIFLKEPGAMAISAILLSKTCFPFIKNSRFQYATLALLFINVSLGGLLAPFTSRSLFLVAAHENWDVLYTFTRFGWKVLIIILVNNSIYYWLFKGVFASKKITVLTKEKREALPPAWVMVVNLFFLTCIVLFSEYPPLFLGAFFLFLGFHRATHFFQGSLLLKQAIFVGFFFASLLIHGELQSWWATRFLQDLNFEGALLISTLLSALIDNAVVLFLLDKIEPLHEAELYAIVVGALSSGGLTLMANAPNLIGYNTLRGYLKKVSLVSLFLAAILPTLISLAFFWILS